MTLRLNLHPKSYVQTVWHRPMPLNDKRRGWARWRRKETCRWLAEVKQSHPFPRELQGTWFHVVGKEMKRDMTGQNGLSIDMISLAFAFIFDAQWKWKWARLRARDATFWAPRPQEGVLFAPFPFLPRHKCVELCRCGKCRRYESRTSKTVEEKRT